MFVGASDPVRAGYVASLARPGGNITGFTLYEPTLAGKWLTPGISRVLINPDKAILRGTFYSQAFEAAAAALGIEPILAKVYNPQDVETASGSLGKLSIGLQSCPPVSASNIAGRMTPRRVSLT